MIASPFTVLYTELSFFFLSVLLLYHFLSLITVIASFNTTSSPSRKLASQGFKAAKFGWGPFGSSTLDFDVQLVKVCQKKKRKEGAMGNTTRRNWRH